MNLRWLIGNFSDPEFNLTRAQQREVTRLAHRKHLSGRTLGLWTIGMTLAAWLLFGFGWEPLSGVFAGVGLQPSRAYAMITFVVSISVAAAWLYRFIYIKPARMAMRELGYDICIGCGHRLQGLPPTSPQCPECGTPRPRMAQQQVPAPASTTVAGQS